MNIVICDDDVSVLETIKQTVADAFGNSHQISCFKNAAEIRAAFSKNPALSFDLLIADIRLGEENGIDLARFMQLYMKKLYVIFITGFPEEYYEDIFKNVKPYGFLGKPVKNDLLIKYINEIEELLIGGKKKVNIKYNGDIIDIEQENIIFFESVKRLINIYAAGKSYTSYGKLDDIEKTLEKRFVRCHKSFIVNLDYVVSMNKGEFTMANGRTVPISRQYEKEARIKYFIARGNLK